MLLKELQTAEINEELQTAEVKTELQTAEIREELQTLFVPMLVLVLMLVVAR